MENWGWDDKGFDSDPCECYCYYYYYCESMLEVYRNWGWGLVEDDGLGLNVRYGSYSLLPCAFGYWLFIFYVIILYKFPPIQLLINLTKVNH